MTGQNDSPKKYLQALEHLKKKERILFITTSNRWGGEKPKSTRLALKLAKSLGNKAKIIDASKLKIFPCEGNVSAGTGNHCGVPDARLKNRKKNPTGLHRCWASINNPSDELWHISSALFESDCVVFFGSVRWGQMNSIYQKLIERLTWLENRHSTLGENNLLEKTEAGIIVIGHNWRAQQVMAVQKAVLTYFGFAVKPELCWVWQYTEDDKDESAESYKKAAKEFDRIFEA